MNKIVYIYKINLVILLLLTVVISVFMRNNIIINNVNITEGFRTLSLIVMFLLFEYGLITLIQDCGKTRINLNCDCGCSAATAILSIMCIVIINPLVYLMMYDALILLGILTI